MIDSNLLIAIATYKESKNIHELINKIRENYLKTKILIVNDNSNDNTAKIIEKMNDKNIVYMERPKKLGLGTAHKLSLFFAIKNKFDYILTLDADFSHDPNYIPQLLKKIGPDNFVIGSRFCKGAKSDYKGYRKIISICGNYFAKKFLNIKLDEITTYFRVYSVKLLKKLPYDELNAQGYSLGVKLIWFMKKLDANLIEVPIHFKDRYKGKSKIPKLQIFISFFDLILIKFNDIFKSQKFYETNPTYKFDITCSKCLNNFFTRKNKSYICLICDKRI